MSKPTMGEFEQLVLLAVLRLGDGAYGVPILDEIHRRTRRSVLRPAVYVALRRLEEKGLLHSQVGSPLPERGGRARKYYRVTVDGLAVLGETRRDLLGMWDGLEEVLDRG